MVSNDGQIKNVKKNTILSCNCNSKNAYRRVNINKETVYVHHAVANAFLQNPNNYKYINHKDENKLNNCMENLEWCTQKYNCNYGERNKKILDNDKKRIEGIKKYFKYEYSKEKHGAWGTKNKTSSKRVKCKNTNEVYDSLADAFNKTGICFQSISSACRGKIKGAGKDGKGKILEWEYLND